MVAMLPRRSPRWLALNVLLLSGSSTLRLTLQFLLFPVLARLLSPAEFGMVALAMPVVLIVMTLAEGGMGPALVRASDPDGTVEATMFWTTMAQGCALALLLFAAAPLIADALSHPEIAPILQWLSPTLVLGAVCGVPAARIQRSGATWIFAVGDVGAAVISTAVALYGALQGWGAWSLVAQQLVVWTIKAAVLASLAGLRIRARPERQALMHLLRHGAPMVGSNLLALFARSIDALLVGRLLGVEQLGVYTLAAQIIRIPEAVLVGPVFVSFLPAMVRLEADRAASSRAFATTLRLMLSVAAPLMLGLAVVADLAVQVVFGARWGGATIVLMLLAPAAVAQAVGWLSTAVLLARGRSGLHFRIALLGAGLTAVAVLGGTAFGLAGVAAGGAIAVIAANAVSLAAAMRELRLAPRALWAATWSPLSAAMMMAAGVVGLRSVLPPGLGPVVELALAVGVGTLFYVGLLAMLAPGTLAADARRLLRRGDADAP
jgi:PST family polysaccharide transporter